MKEREGNDKPAESAGATPKAAGAAKERRSRDRVADDQGSGSGASSALSKLKMIERRRAQFRPVLADGKEG